MDCSFGHKIWYLVVLHFPSKMQCIMTHLVLIMGYVVHPSIYYSTYDLHWGLGNSAFWRGNGMHSKNAKTSLLFSLCLQWSCHTGYTMLFLIWDFSLCCRAETWSEMDPFQRAVNICCSLIKSTIHVSPTQGSEPVRVRKPSGKHTRLSL